VNAVGCPPVGEKNEGFARIRSIHSICSQMTECHARVSMDLRTDEDTYSPEICVSYLVKCHAQPSYPQSACVRCWIEFVSHSRIGILSEDMPERKNQETCCATCWVEDGFVLLGLTISTMKSIMCRGVLERPRITLCPHE